MLTIFAENFLRAPFASWQAAQIARAEICRLLQWHGDFVGRSEPPGKSGDCLCQWWASAYRQPGINCKGRLRRGRTDFSQVTIHHSVFIASGILQGIEKVSARRYNHFSHRCFKQVEPREKTAASVKNLLRTASGYFCTPPVGCAHYRDLNWTKGPLRSPQPGCCYTLQTWGAWCLLLL